MSIFYFVCKFFSTTNLNTINNVMNLATFSWPMCWTRTAVKLLLLFSAKLVQQWCFLIFDFLEYEGKKGCFFFLFMACILLTLSYLAPLWLAYSRVLDTARNWGEWASPCWEAEWLSKSLYVCYEGERWRSFFPNSLLHIGQTEGTKHCII